MPFKNEIEQCLEQIRMLEESFQQVIDVEMLPLSFFSSSHDILRQLSTDLHTIESLQFQMMEKHLKKMETPLNEPKESYVEEKSIPIENPIENYEKEPIISKELVSNGFLGDRISKKLFVDFKQSLSLNDRFRFQRDLFGGNTDTMNSALEQLNECHSLPEALAFLDHLFNWNWEQDSAMAFRELLEKHFA